MRSYLIAAVAAMALTSTGAYAVDIVNKDARDVTVSTHPLGSRSTTFTLKPGEMKADACRESICEIMVDESGSWVATTGVNEQVEIRNGRPELAR